MKIFTIFKAVVKTWMRSRTGLFFSILFPILLLVIFGVIFSGIGGDSSRYTIFVQNQDLNATNGVPSELSIAFIMALNNSQAFNIREIPAIENATQYAQNSLGPMGGNIRVLVIPQGFEDSLVNRTISALTIMLDPADQSSLAVKNIITSVSSVFNYQLIGAENLIAFTETPVTAQQFSTLELLVPGIISAFIMINGVIALTSNITEFKRRGILKRLSITPLTKIDWVIGNILSQMLLNFMLTGLMIGLSWAFLNVRLIPDVFTIAIILLGSIMFSGIGMALSGVIKDVEAATAIGNVIAFPMMYLSGTFYPLELMPSFIQTVAKALPLTYFSEGLKYSMLYKYPEGIYMNMAVIAALAVIFIIVGALVTRWKSK